MTNTLKNAINEFFARFGAILIWVGVWDILIQFVKEENYLGNVILIISGFILWLATGELTQNNRAATYPIAETKQQIQIV